ncbi:MAG: PQQ-binding-like beta-propeller repeat protein [Chitinophagaceae bacterium]|nr:PQQ-binding-like beta-propeller repeat protein [Chitinophagaceae bacterium]
MKTKFNKLYWLTTSLLAITACEKTNDLTLPVVQSEQNKVAVISDNGGNIYAANALTGTTLWTYPTNGGSVTNQPAMNNEVIVYADAQAGTISCLNTQTGALKWSKSQLSLSWLCSPIIVNNIVYTGGGSRILGLSLTDGSIVLDKPMNNGVNHLNYSNGLLIANSCGGYLYGIDLTGNIQWTYESNSSCYHNNPSIYNKTVYIISYGGKLSAVNITTGVELWSEMVNAYTHNATVVYNDGLLFVPGDYANNFYAFDAVDGSRKHIYTMPSGQTINGYQAPAFVNGVAYVFSAEGSLFAFNVADESIKWQKELTVQDVQQTMTASVTVANGYVFAGAGKYLYAMDLNGAVKWQMNTLSEVYSSPVILSDNNKVYRSGMAGIVE